MTGSIDAAQPTHEDMERAQYEAIGRFVQAFESIVNECRATLSGLIPTNIGAQAKLNLILHHQNLGADALFGLARSVSEMHVSVVGGKDQISAVKGVWKQAAEEFQKLVEARNALLHGTWYIGWRHPTDPPTDKLAVTKFKPKGGVLTRSDALPENTAGLLSLAARCEALRATIQLVSICLLMPEGPRVAENFRQVGKRWERIVD